MTRELVAVAAALRQILSGLMNPPPGCGGLNPVSWEQEARARYEAGEHTRPLWRAVKEKDA